MPGLNFLNLLGRTSRRSPEYWKQAGFGGLVSADPVSAKGFVEQLSRFLLPVDHNLPLVRVGGNRDGGYVVVADNEAEQFVLSVGVGTDVSADLDFARLGRKVYLFDPFVAKLPRSHRNFTWWPIGIGSAQESGTKQFKNLEGLLALTGEDPHKEAVLSLDVEGAEWDGLLDSRQSLGRFRQIVVELHGLEQALVANRGGKIVSALVALNDSHIPVVLHGNNFSPVYSIAGYLVPSVVEVTFLRRDLFDLLNMPTSAGRPWLQLSQPCSRRRPDHPQELLLRNPEEYLRDSQWF